MTERLHDRKEAGTLLGQRLSGYANRSDVVVLGLARGGVPVAGEIARVLYAPLDVFVVRKLGVPGYEELAMGAIATGGVQVIDRDVVEEFGLSQTDVDEVAKRETRELGRREKSLRGLRRLLDLRGRTVILVDDGVATGSTMRAAIEGVRRMLAARIVVAAGVMPLSTYMMLRAEVDDVVCLLTPREFRAVGLFYEEFPQLDDDDVRRFLDDDAQIEGRNVA